MPYYHRWRSCYTVGPAREPQDVHLWTRRQEIVALAGCKDDQRTDQSVLVLSPSSSFSLSLSRLVRWLAMIAAMVAVVLTCRLLVSASILFAVSGCPLEVLAVGLVRQTQPWLGLALLASRPPFAFSTPLVRAFWARLWHRRLVLQVRLLEVVLLPQRMQAQHLQRVSQTWWCDSSVLVVLLELECGQSGVERSGVVGQNQVSWRELGPRTSISKPADFLGSVLLGGVVQRVYGQVSLGRRKFDRDA